MLRTANLSSASDLGKKGEGGGGFEKERGSVSGRCWGMGVIRSPVTGKRALGTPTIAISQVQIVRFG